MDLHTQKEENDSYILQLVFQWGNDDKSPVYMYNSDMNMTPLLDFDIKLTDSNNKVNSNKRKVEITSFSFDTQDTIANESDSCCTDYNFIENCGLRNAKENTVHMKPKVFAQYNVSAMNMSDINITLSVCTKQEIGSKKVEEYFTVLIGSQFNLSFESPERSMVAALIDKQFSVFGQISFEYIIVKPWKNKRKLSLSAEKFDVNKVSKKPLMVGHRGFGVTYNIDCNEYMENSCSSFFAAYEAGADFIELDVQLTKDDKIVIYHDYNTSAVVCHRKKSLKHEGYSRKKNLNSTKNSENSNTTEYVLEENSTDSSDSSCSSISLSIRSLNIEQLQTQRFYNNKSNVLNVQKPVEKKNLLVGKERKDSPIGYMFPTLLEVLNELPLSLGINIEIKSPQEMHNGKWESDTHSNYNRNLLVDLIFEDILKSNVTDRKIIFSSFDPWVCSMVKKKQSCFPIFFLVEPKSPSFLGYKDGRTLSVMTAVAFAKAEKLDGIVACVDYIIDKIDIISKYIKEQNLAFFTYGAKNNISHNVKKQIKANVDGIIADKLKELLPTLKTLKK